MPKLISFMFTSLNGYYKGSNEDISWNKHDHEWGEYAAQGLNSGSTLLFGRVTYQMMVAYWTSPMAAQNDPAVTAGMNNNPKIVFSRTLQKAEWNNTILIKDNVQEVKKMKQDGAKDMTILGSGKIVTQLGERGLIDEFQIMLNPVVIGDGTTLFNGIKHKLELKLKSTRTFKNGNVLLCYER